ncbi:ABC transporter ATP-binding protein [Pelagibacterium mangrovi]|uniref:ABC transporter ATP-binding protein n=1 Tax=Pelagibacterium mangrovi TaxID=3119828 RepID=UPI002FCBD52A
MMMSASPSDPVLRVSGLGKHFPVRTGVLQRVSGQIKAVDGVDFDIQRGETFGLVGESGCGKSTVSSMLVGLEKPSFGKITFEGRDITEASRKADADLCRNVQIVFQDPFSSLNRRMTVFDIVAEPLVIHGVASGDALRRRVNDLLTQVGLAPDHAMRTPGQFSGGQRQRIGIARALALEPRLIILDEPVSALDVSIQAQVLNLLKSLQRERGLSFLFISHDMSVVKYMADRIGVMYLGRIVEIADRASLFAHPRHPYTKALLSAVPSDNPFERSLDKRIILQGDLPSPVAVPPGCRFHTRCYKAQPRCASESPVLETDVSHAAACHYPE